MAGKGLQFLRILQIFFKHHHGEGTIFVVFAEIEIPGAPPLAHLQHFSRDAGHLADMFAGFFNGEAFGGGAYAAERKNSAKLQGDLRTRPKKMMEVHWVVSIRGAGSGPWR